MSLRSLIRWLSGGGHEPSAKGGLRADLKDDTPERQLGRAQMLLAQAAADYRAAKKLWPRDRKAEDRAWQRFRTARCAQISAEMGR